MKEYDRKITLNFTVTQNYLLDPKVVIDRFNPEKFLVEITPVNPTYRSKENDLKSDVNAEGGVLLRHQKLVDELRRASFEVILCPGELGLFLSKKLFYFPYYLSRNLFFLTLGHYSHQGTSNDHTVRYLPHSLHLFMS